jgi:hypothetical protein
MVTSLRESLSETHIAAVTIVVLLIHSLASAVRVVGYPLVSIVDFLTEMVAIRAIPADLGLFSPNVLFIAIVPNFLNAVLAFGASWLVAGWVYNATPLVVLRNYHLRLARRIHV